MEKLKEFMKRIGELIKSFANPVEPEQSFDELAVAAGIGESEAQILKDSMKNGISWNKFAREEENIKKVKAVPENMDVKGFQPKRTTGRAERGIDRD